MSTDEISDKMPSFYVDEPPIDSTVETFFSTYASIAASSLRKHLIDVRERAWQKRNYPCLGRWTFLDFSIHQSPIYREILDQCRNEGATLIDFGCCLGQDIRQLVHDGVSLSQLRGYDLDPFFIEQGYELFRDGEVMRDKKTFSAGDIFDDQFLSTVKPADYLYVGSFIHLFDAQTQREVCQRLIRIAKKAIAGRQVGSSSPGEQSRSSGLTGSKMMRHSPESFAQMWDEVTSGQWQVESANLESVKHAQDFGQRLVFVVRNHEEQ
jgi:hypothetical protein